MVVTVIFLFSTDSQNCLKFKELASVLGKLSKSTGVAQSVLCWATVGYTDFPSDFDSTVSLSTKGDYRFTESFAFEGSYLYLGEAEDEIDPLWEVEVTGFNLQRWASSRLTKQWRFSAR
jgi:hypothetical protein